MAYYKKIAYQNKEILSKIFAEQSKNKSLDVYGIYLPKIVDVLPTNLPMIEANELRLDNLFLLEDNSIAIIDYESVYHEENKIKYLNYVTRVLKKYQKKREAIILHMIVIYTADVEPKHTKAVYIYNAGCVTLNVKEAFLSEFRTKEMWKKLEKKICNGIQLTEDDLMELIVLPLSYKGKEQKKQSVKDTVELAKKIENDQVKGFVLTGILVFSDKIVDAKTVKEVRRELAMLKVEKLIFNEGYEKGIESGVEQERSNIIQKMLFNGLSCEEISKYTSIAVDELESISRVVLYTNRK